MKKFVFILMTIAATFSLTSCMVDYDKEEEVKIEKNALYGTEWVAVDTYEYKGIACQDYYTLRFTSNNTFAMDYDENEEGQHIGTDGVNGTYTFENPEVECVFMNLVGYRQVANMVVDTNTITWTKGSESLVFQRTK